MGARLWSLQEYIPLATVPGATSAVLDQDVSKCVGEAHQKARNYGSPRRRRLRLVRREQSQASTLVRRVHTLIHSRLVSAKSEVSGVD